MIHFILMPTLECNAECDYCFQESRTGRMDHARLAVLFHKLSDFMDEKCEEHAAVYWLGGEPLLLTPDWFLTAWDIIRRTESSRNKKFLNRLQTNLTVYTKKWNPVIQGMFAGQVGSSLDFPNVHRRLSGGSAQEYETLWRQKFREASDAGIEVGVISVVGHETLDRGARDYYSYYADTIGVTHLQVYPPLHSAGANSSPVKILLDNRKLGAFFTEMIELCCREENQGRLDVSPFDPVLRYMKTGDKSFLPCGMSANCTERFFCCDPFGNVMQCDCWTSFPAFRFGNIFSGAGFTELLKSPALQLLKSRPRRLIAHEDCVECEYLTICHGGCPARALGIAGDLFRKDPYCEALKAMFGALLRVAQRV